MLKCDWPQCMESYSTLTASLLLFQPGSLEGLLCGVSVVEILWTCSLPCVERSPFEGRRYIFVFVLK